MSLLPVLCLLSRLSSSFLPPPHGCLDTDVDRYLYFPAELLAQKAYVESTAKISFYMRTNPHIDNIIHP